MVIENKIMEYLHSSSGKTLKTLVYTHDGNRWEILLINFNPKAGQLLSRVFAVTAVTNVQGHASLYNFWS